ncbi:tetratricopeptide repeat protein [Pantanalinema rosaneae CENA516]|uniref:tetratricopeptide repeat protein n=1 Tax=Pantanalinema rosaneae TaxID=1620701 RepID=UPI003D6F5FCC
MPNPIAICLGKSACLFDRFNVDSVLLMGSSIAVNQRTFATAVLEQSHTKPVLVDFFAQWCGPCQMLKPVLEKLVQEYDFVLAKVDIDQEPELAQTYGVQGVPDVKIVIDGQVQDGFVGMVAEPQIRHLLTQLHLKSGVELGLEAVYQVAATGDLAAARSQLQTLLDQYPDQPQLKLEAASFYLDDQQFDQAEALLKQVSEYDKVYGAAVKQLQSILVFQRLVQEPIGEHPCDRDFQQAATLVLEEQYQPALELLLGIVGQDRRYRNDGARKAVLAIFDRLGDDHSLTKDYRKKLTMLLY